MNRLMWPGCIFLLVGALVTVDVIMLVVANNRPSFAVHPNYSTDESSWDEQQAQRRDNTRLGWTAAFDHADLQGNVELSLSNRDGIGISDADVTLRMYHRARAHRILRISLLETEPGKYVGKLPLERAGHWKCEVTAVQGDDRFVETIDVFVPDATVSAGQ